MPRVRVYEANQVAPAATTGARFRPAGRGRGGLMAADGLARVGETLGAVADQQEELNLRFDDVESRKLAQRYQAGAAKLLSDFQMAEGSNAYGRRGEVDAALAKLREESLGSATNDRMRQMATDRIAALYDIDAIKVGEHATKQLTVEQRSTLQAQAVLSREEAVANWDRPDLARQHRQTMEAAIDDLAAMNGWSGDVLKVERAKAVSGLHADVINRMLAGDDLDAANAYLGANEDELTAADELRLRGAMQEPLLKREAQGDFERAVATVPVPDSVVTKEAKPVGVDFAAMVQVTAQTESGNRDFNRDGSYVTSPKGARGRMQVMPGTQTDPGFGVKAARDNSPEELARVGRDYLAAMLKRYHGDPAKAWAAYNAGPGATDAAIKDGGNWLARMPGETQAYVKKNMAAVGSSAPSGAEQAPRSWDKAAAYGQIDALADRENWSPERRERAKQIADREIQRDEELLARQERQADRDASEWVIRNPGFTDLSQMPAAIRDRLGPDARREYMGVAARNAAPKAVPANGSTVTMLQMMAILEPDKFARDVDLGKFAGQMTPSELNSLYLKQGSIAKDASEAQRKGAIERGKWSPRTGIMGAITFGQKMGGLKLDDKEYVAVYDLMEGQVRELHVKKGYVRPDDYEAAFRNATGTTLRTRTFMGVDVATRERPVYNAPLSQAEIDKAADRFRREMRREPTREEAEALARRALMKPR
jgi:soluble lytic murein transglycosylase